MKKEKKNCGNEKSNWEMGKKTKIKKIYICRSISWVAWVQIHTEEAVIEYKYMIFEYVL